MKLQDLKPVEGSTKERKRIGRGIGSGTGKTSGKGHKGQKARSGGYHKVGFEGGQMPLKRRLPKFGFTSIFKKEYDLINLDRLSNLGITDVTPETLCEKGVIKNTKGRVKVLGNGEISKAVTVKAHKFSKTAVSKIEAAGGKVEVLA